MLLLLPPIKIFPRRIFFMQFSPLRSPIELISAHIAENPIHPRAECLELAVVAAPQCFCFGRSKQYKNQLTIQGIMDLQKGKPASPIPTVRNFGTRQNSGKTFDYFSSSRRGPKKKKVKDVGSVRSNAAVWRVLCSSILCR